MIDSHGAYVLQLKQKIVRMRYWFGRKESFHINTSLFAKKNVLLAASDV
jgi:hypothetical protein